MFDNLRYLLEIFPTGEIDTACEILFEHWHMKALGPKVPELIILPM